MSLINDALKRAREAERQRGITPPNIPLRPVEPVGYAKPASRWFVLAIIIATLGLSLWSFSRWASITPTPPRNQLANAPQNPIPLPPPPQREIIDVQPAPSNPPPIESVADQQSSAPTLSVARNPEPVPTTPSSELRSADPTLTLQPREASPPVLEMPPPAESPLELRLQSIIYHLRSPSVVINGQLLRKGDSIAGAKIIEIERQQVILSGKETNIVLTMPSY
jgi:hypothetical protein